MELRRTEIRAPFDGVLGARLVSPGDRVERETELVRIESVDRLRLVFTVPEIAVPVARAGVPVSVAVAPLPGEAFPGEVYFVAPSLDTAEPPTPAEGVGAECARHCCGPGCSPTSSVRDRAPRRRADGAGDRRSRTTCRGRTCGASAPSNKAERVPVEIGMRQRGRAEITSGDLAAGDRLVSAGTHKVFPGATIRDAAAAVDQPS